MNEPSRPPMVEIGNLWVKYGSLEAVRGISFAIPKGEVFGFIGPNGAGKSSTIRVLATLQEPTGGWAKIGGIEVRDDPTAIRRKIGYMPDSIGLYEDLTVREYLRFFAAAYNLPQANRESVVDDVLTLTELTRHGRRLGRQPVARNAAAPGSRAGPAARSGRALTRRTGQRPRSAGPHRGPRDSSRNSRRWARRF